MGDAGEEWAQLNGADDAEVWVGVTFGAENKVTLKLPEVGEFEIDPHGIDEWLQSHGLRPTSSQRSQLDQVVQAAIERGRQRAFGGSGDALPERDTTLVGHWQSVQQAVHAVQGVAGGDDRAAIFQALAQLYTALDVVESASGGGGSCADEVSGWWRHYSTANEWELAGAQQAAVALAAGADAAASWALLQYDLRTAEVIMQQHLLIDASASWRQSLQPVATWGTADGS
jgi:hypothetical protein